MTTTQQIDEVLEAKKSAVAKQIQEILEANNFALYPFIEVNANSHVARVTLVETKKQEPAQEVATDNTDVAN